MTATATAPSYERIDDLAEFAALCERLGAEKKPVGYDVETGYSGPDYYKGGLRAEINYLVSAQLTNSADWARMVPLAFDHGTNLDNKAVAALLWVLFHVTDDEGLPLVVAHNAFAELRWTARFFLRNLWDHPLFGRQVIAARGYFPLRSDTLLESFVEARHPKHGLKDITEWDFGHKMAQIESLFPSLTQKQKDCLRFSVLDPGRPDVVDYACEDALWCLQAHLLRWDEIRKDPIFRMEMQILPIVCDMADEGFEMDWDYIRRGAREAREFEQLFLAEIREDFAELLGRELPVTFNFNSSQQLSRLFYDWLGLPVVHWTKGTDNSPPKPSVDAKNALPKLAKLCPPVARYWKYSKLVTLRTKYLELYDTKYLWADDYRAHCTLLQYGTIAGRFSCEDFNYQQMSAPFEAELRDGTRFEFRLRDAIKAPLPGARPWWEMVLEEAGAPVAQLCPPEEGRELGWYILGGDYSQIELRVMASQANCTRLIADYQAGADVHRRTAALMLGISEDEVTKKQRAEGKTRNFANIYGQGFKALADQLGIPEDEARLKDQQYRALYPELKPYREREIARARRQGYVRSRFGRKITIHEYKDPDPKIQAKGDMTAGNAVIQGPATGDYVKLAMIRAVRALRKAGLAGKVKLIMNIHDALEFAVRKDVKPAEVIAVLTPAVIFDVKGWLPMVMEWHMGTTWGGVKDLELGSDGSVHLKGRVPEHLVLPAAPPEPVLVPVAAEPAAPGPARTVIITAADVPGTADAQRLKALLASVPGPNTVLLRVPGGDVRIGGTSGLAPEDEARVATILPGALVCYDLDSVDRELLVKGLRL